MEKLNPYLTFPGNCEEAFNFYKSVFGGEFSYIGRFRDIPSEEGLSIPEDRMNKIMHIVLPLGEKCTLMGSDCDDGWCPEVEVGNNVSLSINTESREKADQLFENLCREGKITMQIGDVFWGSYYGMCTDKFGVTWIINYSKPEGNT
ncbi:VOC family protein [Salinimicrobium sp. WS361]|uniref:VOC family protein n=1 Tax=Salinimicrobium sp. WS361 TaxID=3425123 RepID=UPI003D70038E